MALAVLLAFMLVGMVGVTHIIVDGSIFAPMRRRLKKSQARIFGHPIYDMVSCHQCMGMWVGLFCWPMTIPFWGIEIGWMIVPLIPGVAILSGGAVSILSVGARALIDWLHLNISIPLDFEEDDDQEKIDTA
jgi:hypothetical protein